MAAQRHKRGKPEEHLIVAVGDASIGIQTSLRERYGDLDEAEAIRQALEPGVSGNEDPGRGRGLSEVVEGVTGFGAWSASGSSNWGRGGASMPTLNAPKLVSSRDQARKLTSGLAEDLADTKVVVDCSALQASTPSFVDEPAKVCLVERHARCLVLSRAPERMAEFARSAADIRGVADRLEINPPLDRG
jgi:hypothetical protein